MRSHLQSLTEQEFDLAIIGGGIFGACAAWDAAQRGLKVALIERGDFGCATSANCFKIVHGGIRYLQHGDLYRLWQSSQERRILLSIAPHLVQPLPIVIPTYGQELRQRSLLHLGIKLYDLLTPNRNRGIADPDRRIPPGRKLSRAEVLACFPDLERAQLSGGLLFHDGQMHSPARLVLAIVQSAVVEGAVAANYVEATKLLLDGRRVIGIRVHDRQSGEHLSIRARFVLNAAGPFAEQLLATTLQLRMRPPGAYSRDACFVVARRLLPGRQALAVRGRTADPDALVSRGTRHLFVVPWRDHTLVGVWHKVHRGDPGSIDVSEEELQQFLEETNEAYPAFRLTLDDIGLVHAGLVPLRDGQTRNGNVRYGQRSRLIDHGRSHGIDNLLTLIGVRFTTGRYEAARTVAQICRRLGKRTSRGRTATTPVCGGHIPDTHRFWQQAQQRYAAQIDADIITSLLHTYGDQFEQLLQHTRRERALAERIGQSHVIGAQVHHAVRHEWALTLEDVVFRRTDLAGCYPGHHALIQAGKLMAQELGWNRARLAHEIDRVRGRFPYWTLDSVRRSGPVELVGQSADLRSRESEGPAEPQRVGTESQPTGRVVGTESQPTREGI